MKKIIFILFILFSITSHSQSNGVLAKSYYAKAEKEFESKNYRNSLKMLDQAKEYLEGNTYSKIEYLYVMNHYKMGNYIKANYYVESFFDLNPSEDSSMYTEIVEIIADIKIKAKNKQEIEERELEERNRKANEARNLDEQNWLKAETTHTIESYNTYLNNSKNTLYRKEANNILKTDEGFKQIRLEKEQLSTPNGLTGFYFKEKTYSSSEDFEFLKSSNVLKIGGYESYREGRAYQVHEIHLNELNYITIYKKNDWFSLTFYGGVDRTIYKVKKKGLVFDFKNRLNSETAKYYSPSIQFKTSKSMDQFVESLKTYLNNLGYNPRFTVK